jgi:hypothetical protein
LATKDQKFSRNRLKNVNNVPQSDSSASTAVLVTLATNFSKGVSKGLYLGVGGDVVVVFEDNTAMTFKNLAGGIIHPIKCIRINTTGTTATNIVAVY